MFDNLIPTPMKLELNDQQKMIQKMVREFAEKEIAPVAAELDKKEEYPTKILEKMSKLGLLGIIIPTEFGGAGLGYGFLDDIFGDILKGRGFSFRSYGSKPGEKKR